MKKTKKIAKKQLTRKKRIKRKVTTKTVQKDRFLHLNKKRALDAADALLHAFPWAMSKEGHNYWGDIHARLKQIGEE